MTFEEYLTEAEKHGIIDFRIRATIMNSHTEFYAHPIDKNGKTLTFKVEDNSLTLISETGEFETQA